MRAGPSRAHQLLLALGFLTLALRVLLLLLMLLLPARMRR
jgi:hypothetical protein